MRDNEDKISRRDHYSHILLETPDEVRDALLVYGGARPHAMNTTARAMDDDLRARGGDSYAGGILAMGLALVGGSASSFAERCAAEARSSAASDAAWRGDWDWDGPGPFHKCGIDVEPFDMADGTRFGMRIWAAYVGDKPEAELAEKLGRPRGLNYVEIARDFATDPGSDRAGIPWEAVEAVYREAGAEPPTPEAFAAALTARLADPDNYEGRYARPTVAARDGYEITVGVDSYSVAPRYELRQNPERDGAVRFEDGRITFPAAFERVRHVETQPNPNYGRYIDEPDGGRAPGASSTARRGKDGWVRTERDFDGRTYVLGPDGDYYETGSYGNGRRNGRRKDTRREIEVEVWRPQVRPVRLEVHVSRSNRTDTYSRAAKRRDVPVYDPGTVARMLGEAEAIERVLAPEPAPGAAPQGAGGGALRGRARNALAPPSGAAYSARPEFPAGGRSGWSAPCGS